METISIVGSVTEVWGNITRWIMETLGEVDVIFYNPESGLTFLGTVAIMSVAIGIGFLIIGVVQNFLKLRS